MGRVGQARTVNTSADDFYHAFTIGYLPAEDNLQTQVAKTTRSYDHDTSIVLRFQLVLHPHRFVGGQ